jgi:hypothetical protein
MAETIREGKWHWYDVANDLEVQGGLAGVVVDPLATSPHGCGGYTTLGTRFYFTWVKGTFLMLSMSQEEPALVGAFSCVVEYLPFCRYTSGLLTYEWDKVDPEGRFAELQKDYSDIARLNK